MQKNNSKLSQSGSLSNESLPWGVRINQICRKLATLASGSRYELGQTWQAGCFPLSKASLNGPLRIAELLGMRERNWDKKF